MLTTALSFILVLGVLIFIHELGHFLVAKRVGIRVEKFSLGFPPNIFSKTVGETTYCIGLIPLGGFVKMIGENPDENPTGAPYEFMSKTVGQRAAVILAGPVMNYLLAIVLMIGIVMYGQPVFDDSRVLVGDVSDNMPAYQAGLRDGDQIIAVNGEAVNRFDSVRVRINKVINDSIALTWMRGGDTLSAVLITKATPVLNERGEHDTIGVIGFKQKVIGRTREGVLPSIQRGFVSAHIIVWQTVLFLKQVVTGETSVKMMGGPIFIAKQSGEEARNGLTSLLLFMALLSVNLAVLNVLPIPILDGGHLMFLLIEKLKGSPLSIKTRAVAQQVGLVMLLSLIVFVTYNDILRVIRGW